MKLKSNPFKSVSKLIHVPTVTVICLGAWTLSADAALWDGSESTDWNTAGNWDSNAVPVGDGAVINTDTGNIATITSDPSGNPADVIVGSAGGTSGRLDHTAGTLTTGAWVKIGHNGGDGVYNLADTAGSGGTLTGFAQGSGSLNMTGGQFRLGGDSATGGTGTFNMNTSGSVTVDNGAAYIGKNGNGVLNIDNGSFNKTAGGNIVVGEGGGVTGAVNVSGGTLNNDGEFQIGNTTGGNGTVTLGGSGAINTSSWVSIGRQGGTGVVNINGGVMTKNGGGNFIVGDSSNGTLNQTAGLLDVQSGEFHVGTGAGAVANYNMDGGTLNTASWFVVGRNGGTGMMTMTAGTINNTGAGSDFVVGGDSTSSNGTVVFSGGQIITARDLSVGKANATGMFTMSGGAVLHTNLLRVGEGIATDTGEGTVNLNGGTLETTGINGGLRDTGKIVNFNGTLIQAKADSTTFITGLNTAEIQAGGAKIDTQAFNVTVDQAFSGNGALTKSGIGKLTLTGTSTYTGTTKVSGGTLVIDGNISTSTLTTVESGATIGGNGVTGSLVVDAGGTFGPGDSIGTINVAGDLTLGGFSAFEISTGNLSDLVIASALITFGGTLDVTNVGGPLVLGDTFDLFDWSSSSGSFDSVNLPSLESGLAWDQSSLYSNGQIRIVPEPSVALIAGLGILIGLRRRRS